MSWGERGSWPGDFSTPHGLVIDNNDVVYVADRGNSRIQVFDTEGNRKAVWNLPTAPWTLCLTNGPEQVMFVGSVGRVYKMDLTGKILGAFGRRGRMPGTIDSVHQIACPDEKTPLSRPHLCLALRQVGRGVTEVSGPKVRAVCRHD